MVKKKNKIIIGSVLALCLAAGGGYFALQGMGASPKEEPGITQREYPVAKGDITVGIDGTGKLSTPETEYKLPEKVVVGKINVKVGDWVKKGDVLYELSQDEVQKHVDLIEKAQEKREEKLSKLLEDKAEYLGDLNWLLENQKSNSEDAYYNKRWKLNQQIYNLEDELSEATWKRDWYSDDALTKATVERIQKELDEKKKEKEAFEKARKKEEKQEDDLSYQQEKQGKKIEEFDRKITAVKEELKAGKRQLELAKSAQVKAKQDGVVLKVNAEAGKPAGGKPVLSIGQKSDLELNLLVEPEDIVDVQEGQLVEFTVDAFPDTTLTGKVIRRVLAADSNGKFGAVVAVDESDLELLGGMSAGGTLIVKQKKDVLTLQNKAISLVDGKQIVNVSDGEGGLKQVEIKTGFSDGRLTEVLEGLKEGDVVISEVSL